MGNDKRKLPKASSSGGSSQGGHQSGSRRIYANATTGQHSGSGGSSKAGEQSGSRGSSQGGQQKTKQVPSQSQLIPRLKRPELLPRWSQSHKYLPNKPPRSCQQEDSLSSEEDSDYEQSDDSEDSTESDNSENSTDMDNNMDGEEDLVPESDEEPIPMETEHSDPLITENMNGEVSKKRKVRKETRCLKIVGRGLEDRPTITFNDLNQPIGPTKEDVTSLSSYIGTLARNAQLIPLSLKGWKKMSKDNKEELWNMVNQKFILEESARRWFFQTIAADWRCWKSRLKHKHFKSHTTLSACLKDRPEAIPMKQWDRVVRRWNSQEAKLTSETNTRNRMKVKYTHTMGSKSFARVREEEKKRRPNGEEPSEVEMFVITRKRKDGTLKLDEDTRVELESLTSQASGTPESSIAREIFLKKVLKEHPGHAPLYGKGVAPSDLKKKSTSSVSAQTLENLAIREKRVVETQEKYEAMITNLQTFISNLAAAYPNAQLPSGLLSSPLHNRDSHQDESSAPRVNGQINEEEDVEDEDGHEEI